MLMKDKDILAEDPDENIKDQKTLQQRREEMKKRKEDMHQAWGDAVDAYLRGITSRYLFFNGRATRLEFWGYFAVAGLLFFPLYIMAQYVEIPLLPYYYGLVTLLPALAVATRRLHDINKKASIYLIMLLVPVASIFFIGELSIILFLIWIGLLISLFNKPSSPEEGLYGAAEEDDFEYGVNQNYIIKKFRLFAILMWIIMLGDTFIRFDNWSRQAQQMATIDDILERVVTEAEKANLSPQEIARAQNNMKMILKSLDGQTVQPEQITKEINSVIQALVPKEPEVQE